MVPFPKAAQNVLSIFEVFNVNIGGLSLPLACIRLGKYWERILFTMVFPIVIAVGIILCSLMYAVCRSVQKGKQSVMVKSPLLVGWLIALPHLLRLSFLVFPMVSSAAFQAFPCEEFDNGKFFLRADFAVECYTSAHDFVRALALVGILLYPCGISVLYIVLFLKAKSAVLDEKPTALSKALDFLTLDFEKAWFAWELFEAWKKCVCRSSNLSASNIPTP